MGVEEYSKQYRTINTPTCLFRYNSLVFGIASAPAIFQRAIETILQGIAGVLVYRDDILVIEKKTDDEHQQSLTTVLRQLEAYGLHVKLRKCSFVSMTYLGRTTVQHKVQAVKDAPSTKNVPELRLFIGSVNNYSAFSSNLSTKLDTINNLLKSDVDGKWSAECEAAF